MASKKWTIDEIREEGALTGVPTSAAMLGMSSWTAYDLIKRDEFPVPVLRVGNRIKVPVQPIIDLLTTGTTQKSA